MSTFQPQETSVILRVGGSSGSTSTFQRSQGYLKEGALSEVTVKPQLKFPDLALIASCNDTPPVYLPEDYNKFPTQTTLYVSASRPEALPEYARLDQKTRAERFLYYGFLCFPFWIWGFLHYYESFSQSKPASLPKCCRGRASTAVRVMGNAAVHAPVQDQAKHLSVARAVIVSLLAIKRQSCPCTTLDTAILDPSLLESNPEMQEVWRKEEKKWAMRCGYALAAWWSIVLTLLVVALSTGVFGFTF